MAVPPIFPASPKSIFTDRDMLAALMPHVDAWSVMTYDFSSAQEAGPNAPINWFKQNIDFSMKGMVEGASEYRDVKAARTSYVQLCYFADTFAIVKGT